MKARIAVAACVTAFGVGLTLHGSHDAEAKHPTAEQACVNQVIAHHWRAGDLCDTLGPQSGLTYRSWARYNEWNGWMHRYETCFDTRSTTDRPYVLCWDGTITQP